MPTGVIINSLSIVLGGIFGALLGHKLSHRLKTEITLSFWDLCYGYGESMQLD